MARSITLDKMARLLFFILIAYIAYSQLSYRYESDKLTNKLEACQVELDDADDKKSKPVACKQESICVPKILEIEIPVYQACDCDYSNYHDPCWYQERMEYD
jgi:hypothetical protein